MVDKETGLITKISRPDYYIDYYYYFDVVTDEDLKEPDISEYKIQK